MSEIEPIHNSYIDEVIKSSSTTPNSTKTQGEGLRELVRSIRDGYDLEIETVIDQVADIDSQIDVLESHYKGAFVSITELQTEYPTASAGDYANVDAGAGSNITRYVWDASDNSWIEGGGTGSVESVNGYVGEVILSTADLNDLSANRYISDAQKVVLQNTSGINTGDQDISGIAINTQAINQLETKVDQLEGNYIKISHQTAPYTLNLSDAGKLVKIDAASASTVTIPSNTSTAFPYAASVAEGATQILIVAWGTGGINIVAGSGVTLRSYGNNTKLIEQYSTATLVKVGVDEWLLSGDLEPYQVIVDAASNVFLGTQNNLWSNPYNWSYGYIPTSGEKARIQKDVIFDVTDATVKILQIDSGWKLTYLDKNIRVLTVNEDFILHGTIDMTMPDGSAYLKLKGVNNIATGNLISGTANASHIWVVYDGAVTQTVLPLNYLNLELTALAPKIMSSGVNVTNNLYARHNIDFGGGTVTINKFFFYGQSNTYYSTNNAAFTNIGTLNLTGAYYFDIYNRDISLSGTSINFGGGGLLQSRVGYFDLTGVTNVNFVETQTIAAYVGSHNSTYKITNMNIAANKTLTFDESGVGNISLSGSMLAGNANSKFINKGRLIYSGPDGSSTLMHGAQFDCYTYVNTVIFNRVGSQTIKGTAFHNLTIQNTGLKTATGPQTFGGILKLENNGTYNTGGYDHEFNIVYGTNNTGGFQATIPSYLIFKGVFSMVNCSSSFTGSPNIEFRGGIHDYVGTINLNTCTVKFTTNNQVIDYETSPGNIYLPAMYIEGDIIVTINHPKVQVYHTGQVTGTSASSSLYVGSLGRLYINCPISSNIMTVGNFSYHETAGIGFCMLGDYTIPLTNVYDIIISGTGTKTFSGDITINGQMFFTPLTWVDVASQQEKATKVDFEAHNVTFNKISTFSTGGAVFVGRRHIELRKSSSAGTILSKGFFDAYDCYFNFTHDFVFEFQNGFQGYVFNKDFGAATAKFTTTNQTIRFSVVPFTLICNNLIVDNIELTVGLGVTIQSTVVNGTTSSSKLINKHVIQHRGTTAPMITGILDCSTAGNYFYYDGNVNQDIHGTTYYEMFFQGANTVKTLTINHIYAHGTIEFIGNVVVNLAGYGLNNPGSLRVQNGSVQKSINNAFVLLNNIVHASGGSINVGENNIAVVGTIGYVAAGGSMMTCGNLYMAGTSNFHLQSGSIEVNANVIIDDITCTLNTGYLKINGVLTGTTPTSKFVNKAHLALGSTTLPMLTGVFDWKNTTSSGIEFAQAGDYTIDPFYGTTFENLYLSGSGFKYASNHIIVKNNFGTNADHNINFAKLQLGDYDLTVEGSLTNYLNGQFAISKSGAGTIKFYGPVRITASNGVNASGNPNWEFRNGILPSASGSSSFGTGTASFTTNNQNIDFPGLEVGNILVQGDITVNVVASTTLTINNGLNGTTANSKLLNSGFIIYKGSEAPFQTGILDTSTNANTFEYGRNGSQNIKAGTYKILRLSGTTEPNEKILQGNVTVLNTYAVTGSAIKVNNNFTFTY